MKHQPNTSTLITTPIKFIWTLLKPHYLLLIFIVFLVLLTEILAALIPVVIGKIIDAANNSTFDKENVVSQVGLMVALMVFFRFIISALIRGASVVLSYLTNYTRTSAVKILITHLTLHSATYFNNRFAGSVSSDVSIVAQNSVRMINFFVRGFLSIIFSIITTFIIIFISSSYIAGLFLIGILILIPVNFYLSKQTVALSKLSAQAFSALRGYVVDTITNMSIVQQFSQTKKEMSELDQSIKKYQTATLKSEIYTEKVLGINNVIVILLFVGGLLYVTFTLWSNNSISLGEFIMIITLTSSLVKMLSHVGNMMNEFSSIYGEARQALNQILVPHEVYNQAEATTLNLNDVGIEFKNVSFSYEGETEVF